MAKKKQENKKITLDNLIGFIRKGARAPTDVMKIPTGYFELDFAINFGILPGDREELGSAHKVYDPTKPLGIPCGRLVEVFGQEAGGKSYLCYRLIGSAQKMGLKTGWIDTEQSFSEDLAIISGVDLDELYLSDLRNLKNPDDVYCAEDIMDNIVDMMKCGIKVIILDSTANLVPREVMDSSADKQNVAKLARILSQNLGKITQWAGNTESLVVFVNQIREKVGVTWGNPETTPGGRALKHLSSLRIRITQKTGKDDCIFIEDENAKGGKRLIGRNSSVRLVKNRFARPLLDEAGANININVPIYYEPYFPDIEEIIFNSCRQHKVVSVYKGQFKFTDSEGVKFVGDGKEEFIKVIVEKELSIPLMKILMKKSEENGTPLPPEILRHYSDVVKEEIKTVAEEIKTVAKEAKYRIKKNKKTEGDVELVISNDNAVDVDDIEVDDEEKSA